MALSSKRPSKGDQLKAKLLQDVSNKDEVRKRLNADIEERLYKDIKKQAVEEGRTISEITRQLWIEYLSEK